MLPNWVRPQNVWVEKFCIGSFRASALAQQTGPPRPSRHRIGLQLLAQGRCDGEANGARRLF